MWAGAFGTCGAANCTTGTSASGQFCGTLVGQPYFVSGCQVPILNAGGSITALDQSISASDDLDGTSEQLSGLIQVDADIQPGDSGGSLVNTSGQVIGMDTAASEGFSFQSSSGSTGTEGFAIPINEALSIVQQIESGQGSTTAHVGPTAFLGVLISLVLAQSRWIRRMFLPYIVLLQTVPVIAITPLMIMWVGAGTTAVFLVTIIFCLPAIIANTTQGLISVDENLVQLFLMHNASSWQILRKLRFPHSLPSLFVGMRIASGIAVIGAVTGELFAGSTSIGGGGLGYAIIYASSQLQTDYLFALVGAATVLGFSFFFLVMSFEWYFLHKWHESARTPETT